MKKLIYSIQKRIFRCSDRKISFEIMKQMISENKNIKIIDVRPIDDYMDFHIDKSINIPLQKLEVRIKSIIDSKESIIVVYCEYGNRSKKACSKLEKMGYVNVYNLEGGLNKIKNNLKK